MDQDVVKQFLFSAIRTFGTPLIVWLAAKGKISSDDAMNFVTVGGTILIALVWSFANKMRADKKVVTALDMPSGSTKDELKAVIAK